MRSTGEKLQQPPRLENAEGEPRHIGIELEMSGLDLDALAAQVAGFTSAPMSTSRGE